MNFLTLALSLFDLSAWLLERHAINMNKVAVGAERDIENATRRRNEADNSRNRAVRIRQRIEKLTE